MKKIKVIELFAGVGGFRLGLEKANQKNSRYSIIWSNQWEPGSSLQHASQIYTKIFGSENHCCKDIQKVIEEDFNQIPNHDLLVGGFPCQDYSVARTLNQAKGIFGKKGVLWWSIYNILNKKGGQSPSYLMLENVDRLLKSPSKQKGRDFAVMLASLNQLGYIVEWRVINAADYGYPQRRRRVFILGYKQGTKIFNRIEKEENFRNWICNSGIIAKAFPVTTNISDSIRVIELDTNLEKVSNFFSNHNPKMSPFENTGIMVNNKIFTIKTTPMYEGQYTFLKDIINENEDEIPQEFFISNNDLARWTYLKGGKKEKRKTGGGFEYIYSEGSMIFPDSLNKPSRTIVTGEGGSSPSRFKHVIKTKSGKLRRLLPIELEMLNTFPPNHTKLMETGKITPDVKRAFLMGNALVVGIVEKLGASLMDFIKKDFATK